MEDWIFEKGIPILVVLLVMGMVVLGVFAFLHRDDFSDACKAASGHVHNVDTSGYAYVNGKYQYVYSSFDQCLTKDGRVIELGN